MRKNDLTGNFLKSIIADIKQDVGLLSNNSSENSRNVLSHLKERVNMLENVASAIETQGEYSKKYSPELVEMMNKKPMPWVKPTVRQVQVPVPPPMPEMQPSPQTHARA